MATLTLNIEVDTPGVAGLDTVDGKLKNIEGSATKTGSVTTGIFQGIGQSVATAGLSLVSTGIDMAIDKVGQSIELASNKEEAATKVAKLFGDSTDIVTAASEHAATSVGLSSGAYLEQAGNLGNLVTNLGFTGDAAASMSVDMLQLAGDMGSFNNADTSDVVEAMGAAFRGETEPIRRFGVMLDDASVKAKAMELGLYSGVGALDKNAKATATYQLILEQTTAAQGDFADTSSGLANTQKITAAQMDDAWTKVGEALTPIAADILPLIADAVVWVADGIAVVIGAVKSWIDDNQELIGHLKEWASILWDLYTKYIAGLINILSELGYRIGGVIGAVVDLAGALIDTGSAIVKVLSGDFTGAAEAGQRALDRLGGFAENVQRAMGDTGRRAADEAVAASENASAAAATAWESAKQSALDSMAPIPLLGKALGQDTGANITSGTAAGLHAGTPAVDAAAAAMASTVPDETAKAAQEAARIAAQTPGDIADGLRSGRDAVGSAMSQLKDDMKKAIDPAKEMAQLEAQLTGKALAKGLGSTDPIVRNQAQQTVDTIQARLDSLKGVATTAGQTGTTAVATGMGQKSPAVTSAANDTVDIVKTQLAVMETGSRIAGNVATTTLAATLNSGQNIVRMAGANVGAAWGQGVVAGIQASRDNIARAASYATGPIHGSSPPKVGPLHHIDDWGANIGEAWRVGLAKGMGAPITPPGLATPGPMGLSAASGMLGPEGGGAPAPFVVNVQAGVGDPVAIGQAVVDSIQAYERSSGRAWRS